MKRYILYGLLFFCCSLLLMACYTPSPEKYFGLAVLNSNMLVGFADEGQLRQLESPSVKITESTGRPEPLKRSEVLGSKIQFVEANYKKLRELKQTGDTKDMLQTSLALYEYVLPVFKTEYRQLAELYDKHASKKIIQSLAQVIHDKYYFGFSELYNKLISIGKLYAERHAIKVNWE